MVRKRCVEEFYVLPMKMQDYGEPDMGETWWDEGSDWSGRAFHLMRVAKAAPNDPIWKFIRNFVTTYFSQMKTNPQFDGIDELVDFIGLIKVCEEQGMHFDGKEIMKNYLTCAELVDSLIAFQDFSQIYPTVFQQEFAGFDEFLKKNLKEWILYSLNRLYEYDYWERAESLVEEIPYMLREHGLRYTKKYKEKIDLIAGWHYEEPRNTKKTQRDNKKEVFKEEEDYEQVKDQAYEWLFGEKTSSLENCEIVELIRQQGFLPENEQKLIDVVNSREPWYVCEMLGQEAMIKALRRIEDIYNDIPLQMDMFMNRIILDMVGGDFKLGARLIGFSAEYIASILFKDYPQITEKLWKSLPVYQDYVKENPEFEHLLFEYILAKNQQWIEMQNPLLMIYCMCRALANDEEIDWEDLLEHGKSDINYDWKDWMIRTFYEIRREQFDFEYVMPQIRDFIDKLNQDGDRILNLLKALEYELDIDKNGELSGMRMFMPTAIELLEVLEIAEIKDSVLTKEQLVDLKKRDSICRKRGAETCVCLYKETDIEFLKKCGVYQMLEEYLKDAENYCM